MARKTEWDTARLIAADKKHIWHPFTPMGQWCAPEHEPLVLVEGRGALLWDSEGREYIDGNSSIWTNIHGHNHPHINAAIRRQLDRVAHTSFLGFTNPAAIELAESLVALFPPNTLTRVFYSDDGSTGMEAALRITDQYWQLNGSSRFKFIALKGGYHGDTAGAASLGAGPMFGALRGFTSQVMQIESLEMLRSLDPRIAEQIQAVVIEPLIQGAAGMRLWPEGTLAAVRKWCDQAGALLIADEVMTGFGRTGKMFACSGEHVVPDIMVLGKGLTAGYVPLAVTAVSEKVFKPFHGGSGPRETLYYGHSYTGNAIGCAAARASLEVFVQEHVLTSLELKIELLRSELRAVSELEAVLEVRQCGFIVGIELDESFAPARNAGGRGLGAAVCRAARKHGLLTRPIRNVVALMPPLCITDSQLKQAVVAIHSAILEVFDGSSRAAPASLMAKKTRLDVALVETGLCETREQAQRAVMAGQVRLDDRVLNKSSVLVEPGANLSVIARPKYVGRGGLKLEGALDHLRLDPAGQIALDIGASTGGFTDCLLQRDVAKVYAIDVGHGQLAWKIRNDPRVVVRENLNARHLSHADIPEPIELCVIDVSFISLTLILPSAFELLTPSGVILALIKPQFELQPQDVGRGGIVADPTLHEKAQRKIAEFIEAQGNIVAGITPSPITGMDGNQEFFICARKPSA